VQYTHGADLSEIVEVAAQVRAAGVAANLSAATINRRLAILRRVANLAHEWGWLPSPLGPRIKLLPGEKARHVYLSPDQVERLAAACSNPACALAIRLSARTGLRETEVLRAATIRDGCIAVAAEDAKSGRPRLVPVQPDLPGLTLPIGITYHQLRRDFEAARMAAGLFPPAHTLSSPTRRRLAWRSSTAYRACAGTRCIDGGRPRRRFSAMAAAARRSRD